jgi:hypothetical protein
VLQKQQLPWTSFGHTSIFQVSGVHHPSACVRVRSKRRLVHPPSLWWLPVLVLINTVWCAECLDCSSFAGVCGAGIAMLAGMVYASVCSLRAVINPHVCFCGGGCGCVHQGRQRARCWSWPVISDVATYVAAALPAAFLQAAVAVAFGSC